MHGELAAAVEHYRTCIAGLVAVMAGLRLNVFIYVPSGVLHALATDAEVVIERHVGWDGKIDDRADEDARIDVGDLRVHLIASRPATADESKLLDASGLEKMKRPLKRAA